MYNINIVLFEPEIPQNTGNIARTCAATASKLHLIGPMGFEINDKYLKRAGLDYWNLLDIFYYKNIDEFFKKNTGPFFFFSTKASIIYSDIKYPEKCFLVFGKETAGLPEKLLCQNYSSSVRIPMINESRSLNLSNSVALSVYEVLRQHNFNGMKTIGKLSTLN